jgi:hypothetical protein
MSYMMVRARLQNISRRGFLRLVKCIIYSKWCTGGEMSYKKHPSWSDIATPKGDDQTLWVKFSSEMMWDDQHMKKCTDTYSTVYITLCEILIHFISFYCFIILCYMENPLQLLALQYITSQYVAWHLRTLHYTTSHYITTLHDGNLLQSTNIYIYIHNIRLDDIYIYLLYASHRNVIGIIYMYIWEVILNWPNFI